MTIGTNYKRNKDREDVRRENNLANHFELMNEFIQQGLDRETASHEAYIIITNIPHMGNLSVNLSVKRNKNNTGGN